MGLIVNDSLESLLYQPLNISLKEHKVEVSDEAAFYVHHLFAEYLKSSKFHTVSGFSNTDKPLAIMVREAYDAPTMSEQMWRFVAIGDHTFFIASFFSGQVNRHFDDIGYCIGIGSDSYMQAGDLCLVSEKNLSKLYHELGVNFEGLVGVATYALAYISKK